MQHKETDITRLPLKRGFHCQLDAIRNRQQSQSRLQLYLACRHQKFIKFNTFGVKNIRPVWFTTWIVKKRGFNAIKFIVSIVLITSWFFFDRVIEYPRYGKSDLGRFSVHTRFFSHKSVDLCSPLHWLMAAANQATFWGSNVLRHSLSRPSANTIFVSQLSDVWYAKSTLEMAQKETRRKILWLYCRKIYYHLF